MENLRQNQKEMPQIKTLQQKRENAFDVMISRLDTAGKRINELEGASTEISQTESRINTKNLHKYQNTEKRTQTAENQR